MVKSMISRIKDPLRTFLNTIGFKKGHQDTISLLKLQRIFSALEKVYPYSSSALDPTSLNVVINDIVVNQRKVVVELGSGISTIVISKLLEINELDTKFYSIDSDENWTRFIQSCLIAENLTDKCQLTYIPIAVDSNHWYDEKLVSGFKNQVGKIDSLIIDGPIAYTKDRQLSRMGALKNFHDVLSDNRAVFLHDAERPGEKQVLKIWKKRYGFEFQTTQKMAIHLKGQHFNIV